jgi:hypothetical protein
MPVAYCALAIDTLQESHCSARGLSHRPCRGAEQAASLTDVRRTKPLGLPPKLRVRLPVWCAATLAEYRRPSARADAGRTSSTLQPLCSLKPLCSLMSTARSSATPSSTARQRPARQRPARQRPARHPGDLPLTRRNSLWRCGSTQRSPRFAARATRDERAPSAPAYSHGPLRAGSSSAIQNGTRSFRIACAVICLL